MQFFHRSLSCSLVLFMYKFFFCSQGLLDPVLALNLSTYLVQEKHPVPWALARGKSKCLMGLLSKAHKLLYKVTFAKSRYTELNNAVF